VAVVAPTRVKGIVFRNNLRMFEKVYGPAKAAAMIDGCDPELQGPLRYGTIASVKWAPLAWQKSMLAAMERVSGDPSAIRAIGKKTTLADLGGVYSVFARAIGARGLLAISTRFFHQYYESGQATVHESRAGYARASWTECHGFDARNWAGLLGGVEAILEVCGGREIRIHVVDGGRDGDSSITLEGFWI